MSLSKQRAADVETFYRIGDYQLSSAIGDTIFEVENIYDAIALGYSALANHMLAFGISRKVNGLVDRVYSSNFARANMKAQDAFDYLISHISDLNKSDRNDQDFFLDQLKAYAMGISSCRILQNNKQVIFLRYLTDGLESLPKNAGFNSVALEAELCYFDILNQLENREYDDVIGVLIPRFENLVKGTANIDHREKMRIAVIYDQLSEYCNYFAKEYMDEDQRLITLSINLLIHSRDYSMYAKGGTSDFMLHSWEDIRSVLEDGSKACLFFVYARSTDSWNYIWCFDNRSTKPELVYGGHSYRSEDQSLESINRDFPDCSRFYVVGTNDMMYTDFANDDRIFRLHSLSEIMKAKTSGWDNRPVATIGNINYSCQASASEKETDEYKGHKEGAKNFASAKRELDSMSSIFGNALTVHQGNDVTKKTFRTLSPNVSILHISTHGVFNKEYLRELNRQNPEDGMTGDNILKSCMLKLSGYNNDNVANTISAYEVRTLELTNTDFVFISACESGAGLVLGAGDFSMAEAFRIAGVKNIIAVIDPIKEDVATEFAECLYREIASGCSYHDAFYNAKKSVCPTDRIILFE